MNTKADLCRSKDDDSMQRAGVIRRCYVFSLHASGWKMIQFFGPQTNFRTIFFEKMMMTIFINGYWHLKFERFSRNRNPRAVSEPIIISLEVITLMKLNQKL